MINPSLSIDLPKLVSIDTIMDSSPADTDTGITLPQKDNVLILMQDPANLNALIAHFALTDYAQIKALHSIEKGHDVQDILGIPVYAELENFLMLGSPSERKAFVFSQDLLAIDEPGNSSLEKMPEVFNDLIVEPGYSGLEKMPEVVNDLIDEPDYSGLEKMPEIFNDLIDEPVNSGLENMPEVFNDLIDEPDYSGLEKMPEIFADPILPADQGDDGLVFAADEQVLPVTAASGFGGNLPGSIPEADGDADDAAPQTWDLFEAQSRLRQQYGELTREIQLDNGNVLRSYDVVNPHGFIARNNVEVNPDGQEVSVTPEIIHPRTGANAAASASASGGGLFGDAGSGISLSTGSKVAIGGTLVAGTALGIWAGIDSDNLQETFTGTSGASTVPEVAEPPANTLHASGPETNPDAAVLPATGALMSGDVPGTNPDSPASDNVAQPMPITAAGGSDGGGQPEAPTGDAPGPGDFENPFDPTDLIPNPEQFPLLYIDSSTWNTILEQSTVVRILSELADRSAPFVREVTAGAGEIARVYNIMIHNELVEVTYVTDMQDVFIRAGDKGALNPAGAPANVGSPAEVNFHAAPNQNLPAVENVTPANTVIAGDNAGNNAGNNAHASAHSGGGGGGFSGFGSGIHIAGGGGGSSLATQVIGGTVAGVVVGGIAMGIWALADEDGLTDAFTPDSSAPAAPDPADDTAALPQTAAMLAGADLPARHGGDDGEIVMQDFLVNDGVRFHETSTGTYAIRTIRSDPFEGGYIEVYEIRQGQFAAGIDGGELAFVENLQSPVQHELYFLQDGSSTRMTMARSEQVDGVTLRHYMVDHADAHLRVDYLFGEDGLPVPSPAVVPGAVSTIATAVTEVLVTTIKVAVVAGAGFAIWAGVDSDSLSHALGSSSTGSARPDDAPVVPAPVDLDSPATNGNVFDAPGPGTPADAPAAIAPAQPLFNPLTPLTPLDQLPQWPAPDSREIVFSPLVADTPVTLLLALAPRDGTGATHAPSFNEVADNMSGIQQTLSAWIASAAPDSPFTLQGLDILDFGDGAGLSLMVSLNAYVNPSTGSNSALTPDSVAALESAIQHQLAGWRQGDAQAQLPDGSCTADFPAVEAAPVPMSATENNETPAQLPDGSCTADFPPVEVAPVPMPAPENNATLAQLPDGACIAEFPVIATLPVPTAVSMDSQAPLPELSDAVGAEISALPMTGEMMFDDGDVPAQGSGEASGDAAALLTPPAAGAGNQGAGSVGNGAHSAFQVEEDDIEIQEAQDGNWNPDQQHFNPDELAEELGEQPDLEWGNQLNELIVAPDPASRTQTLNVFGSGITHAVHDAGRGGVGGTGIPVSWAIGGGIAVVGGAGVTAIALTSTDADKKDSDGDNNNGGAPAAIDSNAVMQTGTLPDSLPQNPAPASIELPVSSQSADTPVALQVALGQHGGIGFADVAGDIDAIREILAQWVSSAAPVSPIAMLGLDIGDFSDGSGLSLMVYLNAYIDPSTGFNSALTPDSVATLQSAVQHQVEDWLHGAVPEIVLVAANTTPLVH